MEICVKHNNKSYLINTDNGIDISIPTEFKQNFGPKFYDEFYPSVSYYKTNSHEYNLDNNGDCNVPIIKLNIHCSGTHTECAQHIDKEAPCINEYNNLNFIPSQLITLNSVNSTNEKYHCDILEQDKIITKQQLEKKINKNCSTFLKGLIIRTLPNKLTKCNNNYNLVPHPFFTNDAIMFIKSLGVEHIVVDIPSIDKYNDNGKLGNHHVFFKDNNKFNLNTITEFAYIPNNCNDGKCFLNLQISNFNLDAAPSRPILFLI